MAAPNPSPIGISDHSGNKTQKNITNIFERIQNSKYFLIFYCLSSHLQKNLGYPYLQLPQIWPENPHVSPYILHTILMIHFGAIYAGVRNVGHFAGTEGWKTPIFNFFFSDSKMFFFVKLSILFWNCSGLLPSWSHLSKCPMVQLTLRISSTRKRDPGCQPRRPAQVVTKSGYAFAPPNSQICSSQKSPVVPPKFWTYVTKQN